MAKGLTATAIERLTVPGNKTELSKWDSDNLALRVRKSGVKSWEVVYKLPWRSKQDRINIGRWPEIGIEEARGRRNRIMQLVRDRQDPKVILAAQRQDEAAQPTVAEYAETFLAHQAQVKRTWHEDETHLRNYILPRIGTIQLRDLNRAHLSAVFDPLLGTKRQGKKVYRTLHRMLEIARDRGLIESNVAKDYPVPEIRNKHRVRLPPTPLSHFLILLEQSDCHPSTRNLLKLQLLLGQRAAQIRALEKTSYRDDPEYGPHLYLTEGKTKHREPLAIPLAPWARSLVQESLRKTPSSRWLFPNARNPERPRPEESASQAFGYVRKLAPDYLGQFRPSDLRNTATQAWRDQLGYGDSVRITQLCQMPPTVESEHYGYHPYLYFPQRRQMLTDWEDYLTSILQRGEGDSSVDIKTSELEEMEIADSEASFDQHDWY